MYYRLIFLFIVNHEFLMTILQKNGDENPLPATRVKYSEHCM